MKIISAAQTQQLDQLTIRNESISSVDLMERASQVFTTWFLEMFPDTDSPVVIFCGPGNNGGDGLVVARLLYHSFYNVQLYLCKIGHSTSSDFSINLERLPAHSDVVPQTIEVGDALPPLASGSIIIDAVFGSGLNRSVEGYWSKLFDHINQNASTIVAIDIPSGVFADQPTTGTCIKANYTLSFELPKLAFCFPENNHRIGKWFFKSIGLDQKELGVMDTPFRFVSDTFVKTLIRRRGKFDHKGTYGHALLVTGSLGKVGAAVLASKACLRSGAGLVSIHSPGCAYEILQISIPEAMVSIDPEKEFISVIPELTNYKAIGIGCGLGTHATTAKALKQLLEQTTLPLVLDADALNLIAQHKDLLQQIPKGSILTPHPKEFERLFGNSKNDFHRNEIQRNFAEELGVYIILKGAHTCIACPDGNCYFNSTGNPGMATGGSGDVLTGVITGLLAQDYGPKDAAVIGVYLHGLAGDLAAAKQSEEALIAGDIVDNLGAAFLSLKK